MVEAAAAMAVAVEEAVEAVADMVEAMAAAEATALAPTPTVVEVREAMDKAAGRACLIIMFNACILYALMRLLMSQLDFHPGCHMRKTEAERLL